MGMFKGIRTKNGAFVTYNDAPLELRLDLKNHSPAGFEWGYNGSGPRQLALAVLSKFASDADVLEHYESFYEDFIQVEKSDDWNLEDSLVTSWLKNKKIKYIKPSLSPRFELKGEHNEYTMYLDGKRLERKYNSNKAYNTRIMNEGEEEKEIVVYCYFSEIAHITAIDLPTNIVFDFEPYETDDTHINQNFTFHSLVINNQKLVMNFWFYLELDEYEGLYHSKVVIKQFLDEIKLSFKELNIENNRVEDGTHTVEFSISVDDTTNKLNRIVQDTVTFLLNTYDKVFNSDNNLFEASFRFPEVYQSILKPYMLYFEEFLNDLCIETDVSIRKEGLETILSVEPKNKDEALEKIADALKAYLCAPVIADSISVDESLQMQIALTKLYAQCKNLESQIMYKDISLREQNQQIELRDNIINESTRILIEAGVNATIITQKNTILLESLKTITIKDKTRDKKTFFSSLRASIEVPKIFSGSLELKRKEFKKEHND